MDQMMLGHFGVYESAFAIVSRPYELGASVALFFATRFEAELSHEWLLFDPVGNRHAVQYIKCPDNPKLASGWFEIRHFYELEGVRWCILKYKGGSNFDLFVYDRNSHEIDYLRGPRSRHLEYPPMLEPIVTNVPILRFYPCFFTVQLSPSQSTGSQLNVPRHIAYYPRNSDVFEWILRGPSGIQVICSILAPERFKYAKIGRGWKLFSELHAICTGQVVSLIFSTEEIGCYYPPI